MKRRIETFGYMNSQKSHPYIDILVSDPKYITPIITMLKSEAAAAIYADDFDDALNVIFTCKELTEATDELRGYINDATSTEETIEETIDPEDFDGITVNPMNYVGEINKPDEPDQGEEIADKLINMCF